MRLRVYTQEDFTKGMCISCGFVHRVSNRQIQLASPRTVLGGASMLFIE